MINLNCKQHFSTLQLLRIQQSGLHLAAQQEGKQEEKTNMKNTTLREISNSIRMSFFTKTLLIFTMSLGKIAAFTLINNVRGIIIILLATKVDFILVIVIT